MIRENLTLQFNLTSISGNKNIALLSLRTQKETATYHHRRRRNTGRLLDPGSKLGESDLISHDAAVSFLCRVWFRFSQRVFILQGKLWHEFSFQHPVLLLPRSFFCELKIFWTKSAHPAQGKHNIPRVYKLLFMASFSDFLHQIKSCALRPLSISRFLYHPANGRCILIFFVLLGLIHCCF